MSDHCSRCGVELEEATPETDVVFLKDFPGHGRLEKDSVCLECYDIMMDILNRAAIKN